jgi:hypothetical protein
VLDEDARFLEGAGVEQELDPLAGGETALSVELGDPLLAAALKNGLAPSAELFDGVLRGQGSALPVPGRPTIAPNTGSYRKYGARAIGPAPAGTPAVAAEAGRM